MFLLLSTLSCSEDIWSGPPIRNHCWGGHTDDFLEPMDSGGHTDDFLETVDSGGHTDDFLETGQWRAH